MDALTEMSKRAASSVGNMTKFLQIMNLLREVQSGFFIEKMKMEASMACCKCIKKGEFDWKTVDGEDSWSATTGLTILESTDREIIALNTRDLFVAVAEDLVKDCPREK